MIKGIARQFMDLAVWSTCAVVLVLWPLRFGLRLFHKRPVSLWVGTPIITLAHKARGESLLGVDAKSLVFSTYYLTNAFDYDLSRFTRVPLLGRLLPLAVFVWACLTVERLHFYCDRGIFPSRSRFTFDLRELYIYRLLGIDVFFWAYGADVRNQSTARGSGYPNACTDCDAPGRYCICDERKAVENMRNLSRLSKAMFAGVGELFEYTPGSLNDVFYWPIHFEAEEGQKYRPVYPEPSDNRPLRIVHASNHRMFKGTRFLIEAVEQLRAEGEAVELVLVESVPNAQALELYRSADLIFDQCLIGGHGYFALEGMALGKPVMCFVREPSRYLLHPDECPIINTHVSTLKEDLRRVIRGRAQLAEVGRRSRRYVEAHFSVSAFAHRLSAAYERLGIPALSS